MNKKRMTLTKKAIKAPACLNEPSAYQKAFSRGVRVGMGEVDLIIISGTASLDKNGNSCHHGDIYRQTQRTFNNITGLLRSEKACWQDVIQTRCYLKDMLYYPEFNEVRNEFYHKQKLNPVPASVCVAVALCRPELLVEIEVMAAVPRLRK